MLAKFMNASLTTQYLASKILNLAQDAVYKCASHNLGLCMGYIEHDNHITHVCEVGFKDHTSHTGKSTVPFTTTNFLYRNGFSFLSKSELQALW